MLSRRILVIFLFCIAFLINSRIAVSSENTEISLALLSDIHIPAVQPADAPKNHFYFDPQGNFQKAVDQAIKTDPKALIITGDIARLTGQKDDYGKVLEMITPYALKTPFYPVMGNHDDRINYAEIFKDPGIGDYVKDKYIRIINLDFAKIIILDSMKEVNYAPGNLGTDQLGWLERYLDEYNDKFVILCLHHPPFEKSLEDYREFLDVIQPRINVKAVIYGHSHNYGFESAGDLHLINLPAVAYTFNQNLPVGWVQVILTEIQGTFTFHSINNTSPEIYPQKILKWR